MKLKPEIILIGISCLINLLPWPLLPYRRRPTKHCDMKNAKNVKEKSAKKGMMKNEVVWTCRRGNRTRRWGILDFLPEEWKTMAVCQSIRQVVDPAQDGRVQINVCIIIRRRKFSNLCSYHTYGMRCARELSGKLMYCFVDALSSFSL